MVYLGRPADAEDVTQETFLRLLCRAPPSPGTTAHGTRMGSVPGTGTFPRSRLETTPCFSACPPGHRWNTRSTPLLYHLDTGETEDLPVGVDSAVLEQSDGATWSDNFQLALITGWVSEEFPNGREWLYDRETGTLTDVKDLGGVGADVAAFADDETHYLLVY